MKIAIILLSLIFSSMSFAKVGITLGGNNPDFKSTNGATDEKFDSKLGYDVGLIFDFALSGSISIGAEFGYSTFMADVKSPTDDGDLTFSYLLIRPLVFIDLIGDFGIYFGGIYGKSQTAETKFSNRTVDYNSLTNYDVKKRLAANIGIHYMIHMSDFELRPRFMYEKGIDELVTSTTGWKLEADVMMLVLDVLF